MSELDLIDIVEDDDGIRDVYEGAFDGIYRLRLFADGASFFEAYRQEKPALVIVDLMLPDMDGYEILSKIRKHDERLPVLIVSAKADELSAVKGLNKGADDYIYKPFGVMELLARVKAALRRSQLYVRRQADFTVDNANYKIYYGGADLKLTLKEFKLLRLLLSRAGSAVSRETCFADVWNEPFYGETRALDMHVKQIRDKLRAVGAPDLVETVRGVGYRVKDL